MLSIQRFFNKNKKWLAIGMTTFVVVALISQYLIKFSLLANILYAVVGVVGLIPLVIKAVVSLKYKVISIELLVTVAVTGALIIGEFSEAGIVTWLFILGEVIEEATLSKTRSAIKDLTEMAPQTALRIDDPTDRDPEEVDIDEIDVDDYLLVKTGSQVPVDGTIVFGDGHFDEASVTGEPLAHHKEIGGEVFAGTSLTDGTVVVQAAKVGEDTVFGKIIELVEQAEDSKTSAERFIDSFSKYYTPVVLLVSLIVGLITWDVRLAITILVLGCPGALVIGVPVSNVAGIGLGARHGILTKGAQMLTMLSKVDTIVFDKTGTLTSGDPKVAHVKEFGTDTARDWHLIASAEHESDHPLASAIVTYAEGLAPQTYAAVEQTHVSAGKGLVATVEGHEVSLGNEELLTQEHIALSQADAATAAEWKQQGLSVVFAAVDGTLALMAAVGDTLRPTTPAALSQLRERGVKHLIMLSGDGQATVDAIGGQLGLDEAHGGMLPQDKADFITRLKAEGHTVAFVGDGINDSPALVASDVGIAMGNGTATAVEISDVVLLNSDIAKLPVAYSVARATVMNTRENIGIALLTVAFLFTGLFLGFIYMASGMFVHEFSILVVVINALRLLRKKVESRT